MGAPNWSAFAAGLLLVTGMLLVLSWLSARTLATAARLPPGSTSPDSAEPVGPTLPAGGALLANVALTHGLLGAGLLGLLWLAAIPPDAYGAQAVSADGVVLGTGLGVGLYLATDGTTRLADRAGIDYDARLRESLAPARPVEWVVLLVVALPLVAGAEELLFRGLLVGALAAGFGLPAWGLAVVSSVMFGFGHGAQGPVGVTVAATLGLVLDAAFVLTGSLVTVVVAHYVIDALEFVVHEGVLN